MLDSHVTERFILCLEGEFMKKIGEVAIEYGVSQRTLRFWEECGLVESIRTDSGYRLYEEESVKRIRQIMILRSFDMPIADIEEIYRQNSLSDAIRLIQKQQTKLENESANFKRLALLLKGLLNLLEENRSMDEMFSLLGNTDGGILIDPTSSENLTLQKENPSMDENDVLIRNELRIVNLPKMEMVEISSDQEKPEDACWNPMLELITEKKLDKEPGFRNFGYGYNRCSDGVYVYHVSVSIPKGTEIKPPFEVTEFPGGLFAVLPCTLFNIGERWRELYEAVDESEHLIPDVDRERCFEEILDMEAFFEEHQPLSKRQLDLLLPVKRVLKKQQPEKTNANAPKVIELSNVLLCGAEYPMDPPAKPANVRIPWYKLAQSLVKVGPKYQDYIIKGTDTYALIYGNSFGNVPFYFDNSKGKAKMVFAAVEMNSPFPTFPDALKMEKLTPQKCLVVEATLDLEHGEPEKKTVSHLLELAKNYCLDKTLNLDLKKFLFREFRTDGRHVDRIALYIFIQ